MTATTPSDDFGSKTAEIAVLLQSGDIEQAVRTSGELLADCDNTLRSLHNSGRPVDEAITRFVEAAIPLITAGQSVGRRILLRRRRAAYCRGLSGRRIG